MSRDVRVTFFQVRDDQQKRERIVHLAKEYFEKKEPLLIHLPHLKAVEYVDLLLWRSPQDSFLPHVIKDQPCNDYLVLTSTKENPNSARSILNLCSEPVDNEKLSFIKIYELEDLSSTQKNHAAQKRYKTYKSSGYTIIII
ncbi:MAG: DNA polymerase III subunit chi [Chlamydiia bacterium]|nr:DNA polymerase III subunit chi [Chlamydiia bacterium]